MNSPIIQIDGSRISDWESFHTEFARIFGFPEFYGRNMNAWLDCMTSLDEDDGMRSVTIQPGEILTVQINHYKDLKERCPEIAIAILECSASVNARRIEQGEPAALALSLGD